MRSINDGQLTEPLRGPLEPALQHVRALGPTHVGGPTGAELVAAARAEDDELVGR